MFKISKINYYCGFLLLDRYYKVIKLEEREINIQALQKVLPELVKKTKKEITNLLKEVVDNPNVKLKGVKFYFVEENRNILVDANLFLDDFNLENFKKYK